MGDFIFVPVDPAYKYKSGWYLKVVTICLDGLCKTKLRVVRLVCQACHKMPWRLVSEPGGLIGAEDRGDCWSRGKRHRSYVEIPSAVFRCGIERVLRSWGALALPNFQLLIQLEKLHVPYTPSNGQVSFCLFKTEIINYLIILLHADSV